MEGQKKVRAAYGSGPLAKANKLVKEAEERALEAERKLKLMEELKTEADIKISLSDIQKSILVIMAKKSNKTTHVLCSEWVQENINTALEGLKL